MNIWVQAIEIGYEPKTTFWEDFSVADHFGEGAIKDTFRRAFDEWKDNYVYLTELVMVLNHKLWEHYNKGNINKAELYDKIWRKADDYAKDTLKGEELQYFYKTTD